MNFNDKIYVSGHRGFVGKNLIKKLESLGYKNVITSKIDLMNQIQVKHFFRENQFDYVIDLAAVVGGIKANLENPFKFLMNNLQIQNNLIEAAIENKVKKFLFMSSSCCYPKDFEKQPLMEEYMMQGPLESTNEGYALAKICGAKLCEYANRQFDTKFITLASSNVYGPGDHFNLDSSHALAALILKTYNAIKDGTGEIEVWGNGLARREWTHVDDLVSAIIWSMLNLTHTNTFLNVGTGIDISMHDLAVKIMNQFGQPVVIKYNESKPSGMLVKRLDVSKINCLGWEAKISLDEGINTAVEYFLETYAK